MIILGGFIVRDDCFTASNGRLSVQYRPNTQKLYQTRRFDMPKKRHSEEPIITALKQFESGEKVADI